MRKRKPHQEVASLNHIQDEAEACFNQLFLDHYAPLTYFANGIVRDKAVAEDIVEESFAKLWEKKEIFSRPGSIRSYLYTIVHHACMDQVRKVKRAMSYVAEKNAMGESHELPVIHRMMEAEMMHAIFEAMESLPPKCGQVFKMFYLEEKQLNEIAEELQLSLSTVKSQKGRALDLLRKKLPHLGCILAALVYAAN